MKCPNCQNEIYENNAFCPSCGSKIIKETAEKREPIEINERSIGIAIVLSIITLGIYGIYWLYLLVKNTRAIKRNGDSCTGEMLCLIFVPFYSLYWWYTRGDLVKNEFSKRNHNVSSNGVVFLVFALFGLDIVSAAIMQNDFNSLPATTHSNQRSAKYLAVIAASFICPIVNTGIFLIGCKLFFMDTITGWASAAGLEGNVAKYIIFVLVGGNFLAELLVNMLISPIIVRLLNARKAGR